MKQAEFLNLETKQVQWLDASLEHPNLVRVPNDAEAITLLEDRYINFYKNGASFAIDLGERDWDYNAKTPAEDYLATYPDAEIIWQRPTPLRQKVDEANQKLGINERQLSKAIGREESYITKMFVGSRNPKPKTIKTLIADLDRLMNRKPKATADNEINAMKICYEQEIKLKIALLNQANQNAEMYRHKCEAQANLIKWMGGLIALLLILGIAMVTL